MAGRVLDVTSFTTLDYVEATIDGGDFREEGAGVLDVRTPRDEPESVALELEVDPTTTDEVTSHADRVTLTADQARDLAGALLDAVEGDGSDRPRRLRG